MHFLLVYDVVPDYLEKRAAHRDAHLALAREAVARGELVLGGAFADPVDGAALLFRGASARVAEAFAEADPYVRHGLVTRYRVRPWTTVVGNGAESPVHGSAGLGGRSRAALLSLLRSEKHWVVSSIGDDGRPTSAVVGVAVTDDLACVFDTLESTRKAANLARDPRVSLAMWSGAATAQIEGAATRVDPRSPSVSRYLEVFPDGSERLSWPGILHFEVRPTWIRVSDFSGPEPLVVEGPFDA
ncbi:MAG: YciI-like protein [Polyangiaceae bacterium]